jgi:hypothetical protein
MELNVRAFEALIASMENSCKVMESKKSETSNALNSQLGINFTRSPS